MAQTSSNDEKNWGSKILEVTQKIKIYEIIKSKQTENWVNDVCCKTDFKFLPHFIKGRRWAFRTKLFYCMFKIPHTNFHNFLHVWQAKNEI